MAAPTDQKAWRVLNACRHRREHHCGQRHGWRERNRAQRLSASKGTSQHPRRGRAGLSPVVLNACRHRREHHLNSEILAPFRAFGCSTPVGIEGNITGIGAALVAVGTMCSTPVGIEGNMTFHWNAQGNRPGLVLNACRHRREHHLSFCKWKIQRFFVLNACRHRREHHVPDDRVEKCSGKCSTPVGIEGNITIAAPTAFQAIVKKCSTPVGIEGNITVTCPQEHVPHSGAQRLSASKGTSLPWARRGECRQCRAQRLSASKGTSPH